MVSLNVLSNLSKKQLVQHFGQCSKLLHDSTFLNFLIIERGQPTHRLWDIFKRRHVCLTKLRQPVPYESSVALELFFEDNSFYGVAEDCGMLKEKGWGRKHVKLFHFVKDYIKLSYREKKKLPLTVYSKLYTIIVKFFFSSF